MTKENFIQELEDLLETDVNLKETTVLDEIDEWDSLAVMSIISYIEENFDLEYSESDFEKVTTVQDILNLVSSKID